MTETEATETTETAETPTRYEGVCTEFKSQRGFGYIEKEGEATKDAPKKVFVQWKEIQTDDRWPQLEEGLKVEFSIEKGKKGHHATNVTLPGGGKITVDAEKGKDIIPGELKGTVKFFHLRRGFGYIEVEGDLPEGVEIKADKGKEKSKKEVHVARSEIITEDDPPALKTGMKVKFKLFKNDKGYSACDVTNEDGTKIDYPPEKREFPTGQSGGRRGGRGGWKSRGGGRGGGWQSWKRAREWGGMDSFTKRARYGMGGGYGGMGGYGAPAQRPWRRRRSMNAGPDSFDSTGQVEIGLLIKKWNVGGLVGKRGAVIREMSKESGSKMQFGDDNIYYDGENYRVLALSGKREQVAEACSLVANKIGDAAQSLDRKLLFLVPEDYCGMLIGKKGQTINKIQGSGDEKVRCDVTREALMLPGAQCVNICTMYGGRKNVERGIGEITEHLGFISQKIQAEDF